MQWLTLRRASQVGCVTIALSALFLIARSHAVASTADGVTPKPATERPAGTARQEARPMKIRLTIDGNVVTATLNDSAAARDFAAMLPIAVSLEDYAATEKIAYLPRKLSTADAPDGFTPSAGDMAYYAPWGNLAIFHKSFRYSEGLVSLGRIDAGIESFAARGARKVVIERSDR